MTELTQDSTYVTPRYTQESWGHSKRNLNFIRTNSQLQGKELGGSRVDIFPSWILSFGKNLFPTCLLKEFYEFGTKPCCFWLTSLVAVKFSRVRSELRYSKTIRVESYILEIKYEITMKNAAKANLENRSMSPIEQSARIGANNLVKGNRSSVSITSVPQSWL